MKSFVFVSLIFLSLPLRAHHIMVDAQAYPAGLISTVGLVFEAGEQSQWAVHGGFNKTDRKDFGKNDNEQGEGFGLGMSFRQNTTFLMEGSFWGVRLDIWRLNIDWRDQGNEGETKVTVLQPTVEWGLYWDFFANLKLLTSLALGVEVNTQQTGRDVGEGAIGLFRLGLVF